MIKARVYLILVLSFLMGSLGAQDLGNLKNSKKFKMSGSISLGSFFYNSKGIDARQSPYGYSLGANLNFRIYGISVPFYASFNEQGGAFQHPFNRYGISPKYKWIRLHLGWRSMNMSEFSLSNTTFLGAGVELTPGRFRFSAMYGKLKQSAALENINYGRPQFDRKAMAVKVGYGTKKSFIDFIVFKAKDDTLSLTAPDSVLEAIPAYENLVLGVKNRISGFKDKLVFTFDASLSAFSHNIRYSDVEVFADTKYDWIKSIYNPNISSSFNYAGETGLTYRHKLFSLGAKYRRVMPDFKTLGSEYILSDLEAITVNPAVNLFKGKAVLSGSVGSQRNNLDGNRGSTNQRMISSVNLSVNPSPYWGVMLGYSNYTFQQQVVIDSIYNDSMLINQLSQNYNVVPRLTIIKDKYIHNFVLTANYQILNDQNELSSSSQSNTMLLGNLMYSMMIKKMALSLRVGASYFGFKSDIIDINRYGINIGASKKFIKNKLRTSLGIAFNKQDETYSNSIFVTANIGLSYQVFKKTTLGLQLYYSNVNSTRRVYSENRIQLRLSQGF